MKVSIINGPNLNLVGVREPEIYGHRPLEDYLDELKQMFPMMEIEVFQSNHEGGIIDELQRVGFSADVIILNAGGYTHTSVAILDAIRAIKTPVIEVHISNPSERENFRRVSLIRDACETFIEGFGLKSYFYALEYITQTRL